MSRSRVGVIYLLHFSRPYKHAKHYLGFTKNVERRLERHEVGSGARLIHVIQEHGIDFSLVRQWKGTRTDERRLKKSSHIPLLCPFCTEQPRHIKLKEIE